MSEPHNANERVIDEARIALERALAELHGAQEKPLTWEEPARAPRHGDTAPTPRLPVNAAEAQPLSSSTEASSAVKVVPVPEVSLAPEVVPVPEVAPVVEALPAPEVTPLSEVETAEQIERRIKLERALSAEPGSAFAPQVQPVPQVQPPQAQIPAPLQQKPEDDDIFEHTGPLKTVSRLDPSNPANFGFGL